MAEQIESLVENLPGNPQHSLAEPGSIAATVARLARWGRLAPQGLARVEFLSEFSRQRVVSELRDALREMDIPLHEIELPVRTSAVQIVNELKAQFQTIQDGVVSLSGFETAFPSDVLLADSLRILNFNRENLADRPLCQIWWMTPTFAQEFVQAVPDLDSWFIVKTTLRDVIVLPDCDLEETPENSESVADTYSTLAYMQQRFVTGAEMGASEIELLQIILPIYRRLCNLEPADAVRARLDETLHSLKQRNFDVDAMVQSDDISFLDRGSLMFDLAFVYQHIGLNSTAERLLRTGMELQIQRLQWLPGSYTPLRFATSLVRLYTTQKKFVEAELLLDRLATLADQITDEDWERVIMLGDVALLYAENHCYQKAETIFASALHRAEDTVLDGRVIELIAYSYARLLRQLGRNLQADLLEKEYKLLYE